MADFEHLEQRLSELSNDHTWWVAVSGGADSVALLYLTAEWCQKQAKPLPRAVHIHHGISADADAWVSLCEHHCAKLDVPLTVIRTDPIDPDAAALEATARSLRYRALADLLAPGDLLLMGHHLDDQVETVLFRLLRGAGPQGLRGIPEQRTLGNGRLVRPLLTTPKSTLSAWLSMRGLAYVNDVANADLRFDRNYLRHNVLPQVAARWPGYRQTVARAAELQQIWIDVESGAADSAAADQQNVAAEPMIPVPDNVGPEHWTVSLHRWLTALGHQAPDQARLQEFCRQAMQAAADRIPELVLPECRLLRWRQAVHCTGLEFQPLVPSRVVVGKQAAGPWGELHWRSDPEALGLRPGLELLARPAEPGEHVMPKGRPRRPVSQWWQESHVPPWWRQRLPLLCDDAGDVLAVLGCGICDGKAEDGRHFERGGLLPLWCPNSAPSELSG
ncbi:MAG: tRNA lysidine(34) synthetase TilS [Halieaceae bacterium]|nr:tRNA lysidine(34) synthetase TilS [Halieaceae bacterium]